MARQRLIEISGLNIAMHAPHSDGRYIELINDAMQLRQPLKVSNVHMLMLGSVFPENVDRPEDGLRGEIYRFVRLDPNEPWFNADTHEAATTDELQEVKIPPHLLPHLQRFPFVFRPKTHHMYYVKKDRKDSMGPAYVKLLLEHLIALLVNSDKYPETNVTVIPDEQTIDRIFSMSSIENLIIEITRPNPDDGQTDQERWEEKLRRQGVKKLHMNLHSGRGEGIQADDETRSMAQVAALNGKVIAVGHDAEGNKIRESTVEQNMVEFVHVESDFETAQDVLGRTAIDLDERIG